MPYCSVMACRNHSKDKNVASSNISYHRFPEDINTKEKWIDATGRDNWVPSKFHTICSEHFLPEDIIISLKKGYRYIKCGAIPTQKIVFSKELIKVSNPILESNVSQTMAESRAQKHGAELGEQVLHITENKTATPEIVDHPTAHDQGNLDGSTKIRFQTVASPPSSEDSTLNMKSKINWAENKILIQERKIKQLQAQKRRLKIKVKTLQCTLLSIQEKYAFTTEDILSFEKHKC